jgi:membrane-associated protease RseP (regulator of RpoE activity)
MNWNRRITLPWLLFGSVVICAWCTLLSGVGGWIMGYDLATREATIEQATALADLPPLPPLGVVVTRLEREGPAERAGLLRGDIITSLNNTLVESPRDLRELLSAFEPGDTVQLGLVRQRSEQVIAVQLATFPDDSLRPYLGIYFTARPDEPADI